MNRKDLKRKARDLKNVDYWLLVGVIAVYSAIMGALANTGVGSLILGGPITAGLFSFLLHIIRRENASFNDLFTSFKRFGQYLGVYVLQSVFTALWTLLFIIPGIIKGISYSQALYIAYDNPDMSPSDAIKASKKMMKGHKWEYFVLQLSFIGWIFLVILTFGILAIFYVNPYMNMTNALYYENLKQQQNNNLSDEETANLDSSIN